MRKLKLDADELRVESFEASPGAGPDTGTVRGNDGSGYESGYDTCLGESCNVTACLTCLCPHSGPQPTCGPCSWFDCLTYPPEC